MSGTKTTYTLEGDDVVYETNGIDKLWYYYDESGAPVSFELNGTSYHYVKSLQGDVIAIVNDSCTKVVEYKYNSWGKLLSTTGSLASTVGVNNPYRYRGYRYDTETGLYYLQSRYYDPETGRFINVDSSVDTGDTVLSTNMFAYCENNAVNGYDPYGEDAIWLQYAGGAGHMGHTGLLVQNSNERWYYWYWGQDGHSFGSVSLKAPYNKNNIQRVLQNTSYKYCGKKNHLSAIIYFKGDFTKSYPYLNNYKGSYNVLKNNCMQICVNALLKGKFKYNDKYYKIALGYVRELAVPNAAYACMVNVNCLLNAASIKLSKWKLIKKKYLK